MIETTKICYARCTFCPNKFMKRKKQYLCNDLFEKIVILSSGDVALCCAYYEGIIHKNVLNERLLDIIYSESFKKIRRKTWILK